MELDQNFTIAIQARMGSSRFPGKVLKPLDGEPLLAQQLKALQGLAVGSVVIATSDRTLDDPIAAFCSDHDVQCLRGDENNVLSRYQLVAKETGKPHMVRLTGDNPVVSWPLLSYLMQRHLERGSDFTSTRQIEGQKVERFLPKGWSVDLFRSKVLLGIPSTEVSDFAREHVIPEFYRLPIQRDIVQELAQQTLPSCSIDTPQDLVDLQNKIQDIGGFEAYMKAFNDSVRSMMEAANLRLGNDEN